MILEINNNNEIIIKKIDDYIEQSIKIFAPIDANIKNAFLKTQQELEIEWSKYLNNNNKDANKLLEANKILIKKVNDQKETLDNLIFKGNVLIYEKLPKIDLMATSLINKKFCSLILSENQMNELMKICRFDSNYYKWKMTYRATRDGNFFNKRLSNDLVIIKSSNGNVYGSFYKGEIYHEFIFSFINEKNIPEKKDLQKANDTLYFSYHKILDDCKEYNNALLSRIDEVEIFSKV